MIYQKQLRVSAGVQQFSCALKFDIIIIIIIDETNYMCKLIASFMTGQNVQIMPFVVTQRTGSQQLTLQCDHSVQLDWVKMKMMLARTTTTTKKHLLITAQ